MSSSTMMETATPITDIDGQVFACRHAIESGHGFLIFLGYPEDRSRGAPEAVLTRELADHLLAHGFSKKRSGLPLGSVRLLKFRKRLGIVDGRDRQERAWRAARAKPVRVVDDIDGTRFRVQREQKTDLGVTILRGIEIGRPKTSPQVILTPALAALIREWADFPMKLDAYLPFDTKILMNLRNRLGLSWHDDRAAWWAERFGDLLTLEYPSWSSWLIDPFAIVAQQSVCGYDELSHDDCYRDFWRLTCFSQGFVFGLHIRVEPDCDDSRHVERLTDDSPSAGNVGVTGPSSGLPAHRGKAA